MEIENRQSSLAPAQWGRGIEGEGVFEREPLPPHPLPLSPDTGGEGHNRDASETAERIVAIARSWIGTPYVHQASLRNVGCDCLGLLRGIWRELYGEEPEEAPPYSLDWAEATAAETLYTALKRHAREIATAQLAPGDIALFRMLPHGPAKHCGIVACCPPAERGRSIRGADRVGVKPRSSQHDPSPDRVAIRPSLFKGGNLTLIHARQNKRVSEEPLSPFWRSRLAFTFRL